MNLLILGAAGFIGSRMTQALVRHPPVARSASASRLILSDLRAPATPSAPAPGGPGDPTCHILTGDLRDPGLLDALLREPVDVVVHLAAALTLDAEADFDGGLQINVQVLIRLLDRLRAQGNAPRLLFASSISTFGAPLPDIVDDREFQAPQTSYGVHKVIAEQLINDYSRRGFIDGRILRLPIVLTHPGPATTSVSDRIASLVREPIAGNDTVCPLAPDTRLAVASVDAVVAAFIALLDATADAFIGSRASNLPALTVTAGQLARTASHAARRRPGIRPGRVTWRPEPRVQAVVDSWPSQFVSSRAAQFGIVGDPSVESLVDAYVATLPSKELQ